MAKTVKYPEFPLWNSMLNVPPRFVLQFPENMTDEAKRDLIKQLTEYPSKPISWEHVRVVEYPYGKSPLEEMLKQYNQEERRRLLMGDPWSVKIKVPEPGQKVRNDRRVYMGMDMANGKSESVAVIAQCDRNGKYRFIQELQPAKPKDMLGNHIGYKFKKSFERYAEAVGSIIGLSGEHVLKAHALEDVLFAPLSKPEQLLYEAGVLNLWFDHVYEKTSKIISLKYPGGEFNLQISKDGIYYGAESKWLPVDQLRLIVEEAKSRDNRFAGSAMVGPYKFKINVTIDAGCKKGMEISEWEKALNLYDEYQKIKEGRIQ